MTILSYVRENRKGKLKKYRDGVEEYWDLNDITDYIDEYKLWNSFLCTLSFRRYNKLIDEFEKFKIEK